MVFPFLLPFFIARYDMPEWDFLFQAELLQVLDIALVPDIRNTNMYGRHAETRNMDLCSPSEQFHQRKTVLSAAQPDEDMVSIFDELVVCTGLVESFRNTIPQFPFFYLCCR